MTTWDEMTDAQRDERNMEAWDACCDLVRRALADNPDFDLDDAKHAVEAQMLSDIREYARLIKRGQRTRASKLDRRIAEGARADSDRLGFDLGMLWDVEL